MTTIAIQRQARRSKRPVAVIYDRPAKAKTFSMPLLILALKIFLLVAVALSIFGAIVFAYFYTQYDVMVAERVKTGFWYSRGGVYSAESELKVGQRVTPDGLAEKLRLSGYIEGAGQNDVWNGTFTVEGNRITVIPAASSHSGTEPTLIEFTGDKISNIQSRGYKQQNFAIEPEMLIGRSQAKRTADRVLDFDSIPANLRNAILAAEDQRFFTHIGLDPRGIARAFMANLGEEKVRQGGSTITQQLAKNTFLSSERSYKRKFEEAFLALALESNLTKEQIFALYCNEIYLGQYGSTSVHGVEQAARVYFGKELNDLTLTESAAIAGMIKNPNNFGPHKNQEASKTRRDGIIAKLAEAGTIDPAAAETAKAATFELREPMRQLTATAPYFIDTALKNIQGNYKGEFLNANLNTRVYTTLNTQMQRVAEKALADHVSKFDKGKTAGAPLEAAIVAMDPHTGRVLAMVGGRDYQQSQFNRAADAMRQPGSTFKPFVYATALERGFTPISTFKDAPQDFMHVGAKPYKPENYGRSYTNKSMTLKTALARSSNVVAVRTAFETRYNRVAEKARDFGFSNVEDYPSIALGAMEVTPLQLATAYSSFANGGRKVDPILIDSIVSGSGKTLYEAPVSNEVLLTEQTAYMMTDMMQAVVERGTARAAKGSLGPNVAIAGKTGSSKDGWFVGYTPNLVTVVWVGYDDTKDVGATGGEIALPLWVDFMKSAIRANPEFGGSAFPMPKGLGTVTVDPETGMLADHMCPISETAVVKVSAAPSIKCVIHQPKVEATDASYIDDEEMVAEQLAVEPAAHETTVDAQALTTPLVIRPERDSRKERIKVGTEKKAPVRDTYLSESIQDDPGPR